MMLRPRTNELLVRIATVANVVTAFAFAQAYTWSQALFDTADETAHFDYAYEVWHGRLPVFERGLDVKPEFASLPPFQWASQHPPLFYLYEAPFVGPFVDHGHDAWAGYAARTASALIAVVAVLAVMWAVHAIAPGRRVLWLAAGTATAVSPLVVAVGGTVFNDNMLLVWTALTIGLTARILRDGITRQRLVLLALFGSGLLLTRASGAIVFAVCGATLGVVSLIRSRRDWRQIGGLVLAGLVPLLASGWFYLRNLHIVGNLAGANNDSHANRITRSFHQVVVDPEVWRQWHAIYGYGVMNPSGNVKNVPEWYVPVMAGVLVALPLLVSLVAGMRLIWQRRRPWSEIPIAVVLIMVPIVVLAVQTLYVAHRGGASWRYLMPLVPAISLAVAITVNLSPRLRPWLLCGWVALATIPFAVSVGRVLVAHNPFGHGPQVPGAACAALGIGFATLAVAVMTQLVAARAADVEEAEAAY